MDPSLERAERWVRYVVRKWERRAGFGGFAAGSEGEWGVRGMESRP